MQFFRRVKKLHPFNVTNYNLKFKLLLMFFFHLKKNIYLDIKFDIYVIFVVDIWYRNLVFRSHVRGIVINVGDNNNYCNTSTVLKYWWSRFSNCAFSVFLDCITVTNSNNDPVRFPSTGNDDRCPTCSSNVGLPGPGRCVTVRRRYNLTCDFHRAISTPRGIGSCRV